MSKFVLIIACLFSMSCANLSFGNVSRYHIDVEQISNGKVNSNINTIFQDSRGFIWFGSEDGLYRYDGYAYVHYLHDENDSLSIDNDNIIHINEDSEGNLWIGTRLGLNILDQKTDQFLRIPIYWVTDICKSSYSGFWIASRNGLFRTCESTEMESWAAANKLSVVQFGDKKLIHYKKENGNPHSLNDDAVKCLMEDSKGNLWVGTDHEGADWGAIHLLKKDPQNQYPPNFVRYKHIDETNAVQMCRWPEEFYEDEQGNIWIVSWWDGLIKLNPLTGEVSQMHFINKWNGDYENIMAIEPDNEGNLYLASYGNGLLRLNKNEMNKKKPDFDFIQFDSGNEIISENYLLSLFFDQSNTLWVGTKGKGALKSLHNFRYIKLTDPNSPEQSSKDVSYISEKEKGILYIGNEDGSFSIYNKRRNNWQHYSLNVKTQIRHISKYSEHEYLVGAKAGFFVFNTQNKTKHRFFESFEVTDSVKNTPVCNVIDIPDGKMACIFTQDLGIGLVDKNKLTSILFDYNYIQGIYKASDDRYWLYRRWGNPLILDERFQVIREVETGALDEGKSTNSIIEDNNGNMWMALEQGLSMINTQTFEHTLISERDGLPNNKASAIVLDKNDFIWVSTQSGISRINPKKMEFVNFGDYDGLGKIHFSEKAGIITDDGLVYFGTSKGVISFNPTEIKFNQMPPPVYITKFNLHNNSVNPKTIVNNRKILEKTISYTDSIILNYQSNVLGFEFTALNYISPLENQYAYKMDGIDDQWVYVNSDRRFASYAGLPHGNYTFRVKAANNDGVWSEIDDAVFIKITPPWWLTVWFKILLILFIFSIVFLIFTLRLRYLRKSRDKLKHLVEERTSQLRKSNNELIDLNKKKDEFLTIMAHDLKNPIGNIQVFLEMILSDFDSEPLETTKEQLSIINKQIDDTYNLLENLLIWERKALQANQKLDQTNLNVHEIIETNISPYRGNRKNIKFENNSPKDAFVLADVDMLNFILRNLLGNAIKFSFQESSIEVNYTPMDGKYWIQVVDYGTGMDEKQIELFNSAHELDSLIGTDGEKGTGLGLLNCREFAHSMNGEMKIISKIGKGTSVCISLPPVVT